jgi:hypothetical protein
MLDTYSRTEHNIAHVTPVDDEIAHDLRDFRCVCGPKVEFVFEGWVVVHQALDGRP